MRPRRAFCRSCGAGERGSYGAISQSRRCANSQAPSTIVVILVLAVAFLSVIFYGLASRGRYFGKDGGFNDKVNNHYFRTFGSAVLIVLIGTGIDMAAPESSRLARQDTASDAARRNFAETFGRVADRTIQRNMDIQPTLEIRPGYRFNVLVDRDVVFPGAYR